MPLEQPKPSRDTYQAFLEGATDFLNQEGGADFASFAEQHFIRLYTLSLDDVARGVDLAGWPPSAWRFVVSDENNPTIACDLSLEAEGAPSTVLSVRQGSGADRARAALDFIWNLPDIGPVDYELRWLSIPGLSIEAFWLKATTEGLGDQIMPISPQVDELKGRSMIPVQEFRDLVQPLAAERLTFDDGL